MGLGLCSKLRGQGLQPLFLFLFVGFVFTVLGAPLLTSFFKLWKRRPAEELCWAGTTRPCSLILHPAGELGL